VKLSDRLRRWWNPAQWRDDHPAIGDGEGYKDPRPTASASFNDERDKLGRGALATPPIDPGDEFRKH
jgi:hypothetical protein